MTTTARLRLLLAILALVLMPLLTPAGAAAAVPAGVVAMDACDHPCDAVPPHADTTVCAVSCGLPGVSPLLLPAPPMTSPAARLLRQPAQAMQSPSSSRWPPPKRPPRV